MPDVTPKAMNHRGATKRAACARFAWEGQGAAVRCDRIGGSAVYFGSSSVGNLGYHHQVAR